MSRIEIESSEYENKFDLSYDSDPAKSSYQSPSPLIIQNEDGLSITFRQFVPDIHAYLNEHFEEIKKAQRLVAALPWSGTQWYFQRAWPHEIEYSNVLSYVEMMRHVADARFRDILWAQPLTKAYEYERKFQGRRFRLVKLK
ncbi:hypothetical protein COCMIDRAFT_25499 [Bipolaris oryzae ATCC 44560]|uniref:Uncharacterized protein n=1 Tax=Bipolaris oryzae ATCC 44560 TaxID=930090 RepID=W6ZFW6_COCMI|nr:uncharacterized protein COCMIDRAFT_25499 [Bipolaris oryzae ATCC 44560]EUC46409.1 hypothetical protein COCMIDRAFT_25499 [Bipolaris oryzae ATCC 44560]